jgi:hypothetical protein
MEGQKIFRRALALKMGASRSSMDRLLDSENPSIALLSLESVAVVLGKKL